MSSCANDAAEGQGVKQHAVGGAVQGAPGFPGSVAWLQSWLPLQSGSK